MPRSTQDGHLCVTSWYAEQQEIVRGPRARASSRGPAWHRANPREAHRLRTAEHPSRDPDSSTVRPPAFRGPRWPPRPRCTVKRAPSPPLTSKARLSAVRARSGREPACPRPVMDTPPARRTDGSCARHRLRGYRPRLALPAGEWGREARTRPWVGRWGPSGSAVEGGGRGRSNGEQTGDPRGGEAQLEDVAERPCEDEAECSAGVDEVAEEFFVAEAELVGVTLCRRWGTGP